MPGLSINFFIFGITAASFPLGTENMLFLATVRLKSLLVTQKAVIDKLDKFVDTEETLFKLLERFRDTAQMEYDRASINRQYYLENPINSFKLIKRLNMDIRYIMNSLDIFGMLTSTSTLQFPNDGDLVGAGRGLTRLQETYQLSTEDMAAGILSNITYGYKYLAIFLIPMRTTISSEYCGLNHSSPMLPSDCFELARVLYKIGQHHYSNLWFTETLNKLNAGSTESARARRYIYQFLAINNYEMGNLEEGLTWLDKITAEFSEDQQILERIVKWRKELGEKKSSEQSTSLQDTILKKDYSVRKTDATICFEKLCRGGSQLTEDAKKRFKCRYDTAGHTYLKIAPFKVEEAYLDPDILIYHQVLSDAEIDYLKTLALDKLEPGFVFGSDAEGNTVPKLSKFRISQVSWIKDSDDIIAERVSRRTGHMSHLSVESAEYMQVGIYGMGGYYSPHYDLVWLSDELQGGATVFPKLGVHLAPLKGAAVVWRNLLPSSEPDLRTLHGACPVLFGSKWVLNKWLLDVDQEFAAPCSLKP